MNVYQIALLIASYDPSEFESDYYNEWPSVVKTAISPYLNAIKNAARSAKLTFKEEKTENFNSYETDWYDSLINIDSLCQWMKSRNFVDGFFIIDPGEVDRLSDKAGEFYALRYQSADK